MSKNILWFKEISSKNIPSVGGKNASLGEMYGTLTKKGVNIPNGFALTTNAYWTLLKENNLDIWSFMEQPIKNTENVARFIADSFRAFFYCFSYPSNSNSSLGVILCRDLKKVKK